MVIQKHIKSIVTYLVRLCGIISVDKSWMDTRFQTSRIYLDQEMSCRKHKIQMFWMFDPSSWTGHIEPEIEINFFVICTVIVVKEKWFNFYRDFTRFFFIKVPQMNSLCRTSTGNSKSDISVMAVLILNQIFKGTLDL